MMAVCNEHDDDDHGTGVGGSGGGAAAADDCTDIGVNDGDDDNDIDVGRDNFQKSIESNFEICLIINDTYNNPSQLSLA